MVLKLLELYDLVLVLAGITALAVGVLPRYVEKMPLSKAPLYVLFGFLLFELPLGLPAPDPLLQGEFTERITEFGVIVALMTLGLKIDRPPSLRGWESTWRLLGITMPVTIALAALVGWWVGLAVPTAVLLGAVIAPTDPVLASEVQVEGPGGSSEEEPKEDADGREDEVRFALSSEAGLNDGFAFPFTNMAVAMALMGTAPGIWFGEWFLVDVVFRFTVALAAGLGLGRVLAGLIFLKEVEPETPTAKSLLGVEALGATLIVYGVTEFLGGYGFIAVFTAAVVIRHYEHGHAYYEPLHDVAERAEQLTMAAIMVLFGGIIAGGLFSPVTWKFVVAALAIVFVVRPLGGIVALLGFDRSWGERGAISFYGIRGIGTFYYLSFALNQAPFRDADVIWALAGLTILLSVVVGGVTATPVVEEALGEESPEVEVPQSS